MNICSQEVAVGISLSSLMLILNIAKGTIDPGFGSTTWELSHWLQFWSPRGVTWIGYKFDRQVAPLALVPNWPPDSVTCIGYQFEHQVALLSLLHRLNSPIGISDAKSYKRSS